MLLRREEWYKRHIKTIILNLQLCARSPLILQLDPSRALGFAFLWVHVILWNWPTLFHDRSQTLIKSWTMMNFKHSAWNFFNSIHINLTDPMMTTMITRQRESQCREHCTAYTVLAFWFRGACRPVAVLQSNPWHDQWNGGTDSSHDHSRSIVWIN